MKDLSAAPNPKDVAVDDDDDLQPAVAKFTYLGAVDPPFPPDHRKELTFEKGDLIMIKDVRADGWMLCKHKKKVGWAPGNYLKQMTMEQVRPAPGPADAARQRRSAGRRNIRWGYEGGAHGHVTPRPPRRFSCTTTSGSSRSTSAPRGPRGRTRTRVAQRAPLFPSRRQQTSAEAETFRN